MQMTDVDYSGLLVRVTKLERQNRFWKAAGLLMLLAGVFSLTANVTAEDTGVHTGFIVPPLQVIPDSCAL